MVLHDGIWWMFSTDKTKGSSQNLCLFYAEDLLAQWTPHCCNPIKTDVRSSRSAGKPFFHNKNLYRPSMNYSEKNEGSITINRIDALSKKSYTETAVKQILPNDTSDFPDKVHHIFAMESYTLIDGCKEVRIFRSTDMIQHQFKLIWSKFSRVIGRRKV